MYQNYKMSDEINSHICSMSSVNKTFHQTVKHGHKETIYYKIKQGLKFKFL